MNDYRFDFHGASLRALPDGALWWPDEGILVVSDLHFCKSERIARRTGAFLPPYETRDTLERLERVIVSTKPDCVLSLGDSFDDLSAVDALAEDEKLWITRMQAGRKWIWITGNHDPGPIPLPGSQLASFRLGELTFRHIAEAEATAEISGHYHPKARVNARGRIASRPCFLIDQFRVVLPAFGTYTGGLRSHDATLCSLMSDSAIAVLTGRAALAMPMPRS